MFVCLVVPHFLLSDQVTCYHTNPTFGPERSAHLSPTETILQFARCFSWNPLKLSLHRTVLFFFLPRKAYFYSSFPRIFCYQRAYIKPARGAEDDRDCPFRVL